MPDLSDEEVDVRKGRAGKFGFVLGCVAAVLAFGIELFIAPKPLSPMTILTAGLMASINIPLGITFGLVGERMSRGKESDDSRG